MLQKAGFDPDHLDPRQLQLYAAGNGMLPQANNVPRINNLTQVAILVDGESDGKFDGADRILFWGQGPDTHSFDTGKSMFTYENNLFADANYYFLTVGNQNGTRVSTSADQGNGFPVVNEFDDFAYWETDQYNILKSGRSWFGEQFDEKTQIIVRFDLAGVTENSPIKLVSAVMAQAYLSNSSFKVSFNNNPVLEQAVAPIENTEYADKGREVSDTITFNSSTVSAPGRTSQDVQYDYVKAASGTSVGYLNYFLISLRRSLALYGDQTVFLSSQSLANATSQFKVSAMGSNSSVWEVTDPFHSMIQSFTLDQGVAAFSVPTNILRTFVAFNPDKVTAAGMVAEVVNQNLSSLSSPHLLIISHPDFLSEANRLANHRQGHNGISVQVVTTDQLYNEYSGGKQDVTAIRDFIKDLYSQSGSVLGNVLLFGRCSYDYKNRILSNTNYVPTYESRNSLSPLETYSSDDYFAFLEPSEGEWSESPATNATMDIGIGRISVVKLQEATDVVDKLIGYDTDPKGFGPWRQRIAFTADDGDLSMHQSQADQLATDIDQHHPEFITGKVYLDAFKQVQEPTGQFSPKAKDALDRTIENGDLLVNFTGHGSEEVWMQERVLDPDLIKSLKNGPRYPLFVTATCEFGRHDDPFQISSGEKLLLKKQGGGIGLVTTARPVNSSTNFQLNKAFYDALFTKIGGQYRNLGTIFRDTKNNSQSGVSNRNFSLLGDPSMTVAFSQDSVVVNQMKTASNSDTLKALSLVTIQGEIRKGGVKRTDFQGEAFATLFDRQVSFTTLGDENPPFNYSLFSNIIFQGKASVNNGDFQIQFVVPKDLEPDIGKGKLVLYADNGKENASGGLPVSLGGEEVTYPPDQTPPDIQLFIGDTTFINGGIASPNTTLIARLQDEHGISITGLTGANDLLAILDDSLNFVMNEYYTADKDDYRKGSASFALKGLQKGKHHVVVEVSDTYSNRSNARIDFVVTDGGLVVSEFYNYPNPFSSLTESTILGFTHNRPGDDLEADLVVYDLTGHLIDSRHYSITESLSHVTLAEWDGANVDGNKLTNGIYLGKLSVRSLLDGSKNEQITKLIIVN